MNSAISEIINQYTSITLSDVRQRAALLNRVDQKYVLPQAALLNALAAVRTEYDILQVNGYRISPYSTRYYDTDSFFFYYQHHNGVPNRYKVRTRKYLANELAFVEVKHKTPRKRTVKTRCPAEVCTDTANSSFVQQHIPFETAPLQRTLDNSFGRMTLVGRHGGERITLDTELSFDSGTRTLCLEGLAIAEVKRAGRGIESAFASELRRAGYRPTSFSKYCIGTSMLYPVKSNHFKPALTAVSRITS